MTLKKLTISMALLLPLAACSTVPDPAQFATSVNNAVQDTATATKGAVSIVGDVISAVAAIGQPIVSIITSFGVKL